jgi:hypothetical protein
MHSTTYWFCCGGGGDDDDDDDDDDAAVGLLCVNTKTAFFVLSFRVDSIDRWTCTKNESYSFVRLFGHVSGCPLP